MTEKMSNAERNEMNGLANEQLRFVEVRRFLNRMPLFRLDDRSADRFADLLARLDRSGPSNAGR